ncbi:MAG: inositol monophosphatase [Muribaculaceae bacterium]|nr:inositol monophosphatase [Muribaculaceae bacterium]MDE6794200.1 inositol monophosphatase [Muribaculaceae bacterium]
MVDKQKLLDNAISMAREAGEILLSYFRGNALEVTSKLNDYDIVTTADKASERHIISSIRSLFPTHSIITEEAGELCGESELRWVIDPLDGTTNFSQGLPVFSVSIAVEHNTKPIVGVVFAPYLNELFYSVEGKGAYLNGKKLKCSNKERLEEAVVVTGIPYDKRDNPDNNIKEVSKVAPKVRGLRRMGSAALDLCYVAAGFFDAYWELNLKRWDVAAGTLIAQGAGAKLFSIRENRNHSILMAAPGVCDKMLEILLTPNLHPGAH